MDTPEQFQEKCATVFHPELRKNKELERFRVSVKNENALTIIEALSALAQPTRLGVFRALVAVEPQAIPAGELARRSVVPQNTMSAHLAVLMRAGLVASERRGRSILYRASLPAFQALVTSLVRDCCDGRPELCAPLLSQFSPCHVSKGALP